MNKNLRDTFFDFITDKKVSQNKVAREIGYSGAVLSQYRRDAYQGDVAKLEKEIERWLSRQKRKAKIRKVGFVETAIFKKIYGALSTAHEERTMGFVVGAAGTGKSMAINKFAEETANVFIVQGESGLTENHVVRKLAGMLNIKGNAMVKIKEGIIEQLSEKDAIVIVDEANYLRPSILDMLRRVVFDQAGCPVVFVGVRELMGNIFQNPHDFKQLQRRIGVFLDLRDIALDPRDARAMTETVFPEVGDAVLKVVYQVSRANAGILALLVERAYRTCVLNDVPLDEEIIDECRQTVFLTARLAS